jgi:hypothetical protein
MIEKARISVDKETSDVIDRISNELERTITVEPPWAAGMASSLTEKIEAQANATLGEVGAVRSELRGLGEHILQWERSLRHIAQVIQESSVSNVSATGQLRDGVAAAADRVMASVTENGQSVLAELSNTNAMLTSMQTSLDGILEVIRAQQQLFQEQLGVLRRMQRPWWRRLFG